MFSVREIEGQARLMRNEMKLLAKGTLRDAFVFLPGNNGLL